MKKVTGILIAVLALAGIVLLLTGNRRRANEESASVSNAGGSEVVMTYMVTRGAVNRSFTSNGVAQANTELNFVSEVSGRVVAVMADKGSRVAAGAPLLKIDSELLEADYKAAKASYEALCKDEQRFARSFEAGGISSQQLDNVRTQLVAAESRLAVSRWKLENSVVKAPVAGTINNRFVEVGALIAPNVPLFEIVDDSRIKVICNVPESKLALVRVGAKVTATGGDASHGSFTGTVRSVGIKTDRGLNYPVEVLFEKDPGLRVGMYLKVKFESEGEQTGIFVPRKAVVGSVLAANVYVVENGVAVRRVVSLGDMSEDKIEITSGLEEGDEIVVAGLMNISDGTPVTVVNK